MNLKPCFLFLEALNTSQIYQITSKVCFVKGLVNYIKYWHIFLTLNHICPNKFEGIKNKGLGGVRSMKLIPYCTGRYGQNFLCRCLDRYKNWVDSYRLKYRCVSACFGHFGGFWCFSGDIFIPDRYKLKWVFIKKIATYSASSPLLNLHPPAKYC